MSFESTPKPIQEKAPKNLMQEIKDVIVDSPRRLKEEYEKTDNPWLACLNTDLHIVSIYLELASESKQISDNQYIRMKQDLDLLAAKVVWLQKTFPIIKNKDGKVIDKDGGLPESVKVQFEKDLQNLID